MTQEYRSLVHAHTGLYKQYDFLVFQWFLLLLVPVVASDGKSPAFLETQLQYLPKRTSPSQCGVVAMNSEVESGFSLPPDPGGELYINVVMQTIVTA
jgi:hypothetical protein